MARLEKNGVKKDSDGPAESKQMIVEQHPPYEFTKSFVDSNDVKRAIARGESLTTVQMHSVPNEPMAEEMKKRGCRPRRWRHGRVEWRRLDDARAAAAVVQRPPRRCMRSPVPSQAVGLPARQGRPTSRAGARPPCTAQAAAERAAPAACGRAARMSCSQQRPVYVYL